MYQTLQSLLADRQGGATFTCFGVWHLLYLAAIFGVILTVIFLLKNRSDEAKRRATSAALYTAFGLYVADVFLMPFAYGEFDVEKLPFHACTAMCLCCVLSRHNSVFARFKDQFVLLGLLSNLIYVIYPAGVGWYQIHPLCYRVWQTLLYHGAMTAFGLFALSFGEVTLTWRKLPRHATLLCAMTAWALLGNTLYNGLNGRFFNWFFVVRDPFHMLPENVAPFIMPLLMTAVMLFGETLIHLVYFAIKGLNRPR
ncbi:MAG: YwaF family protein [Clostridia bacterium]|nr:YwaF family protein [Clostridia bacterium]